jgi:adenylate kinase family enzyme
VRAPQDGQPARRILVYGVTGSGKSVLARRISDLLGLELVLADELCWLPGWVQRTEEEQRRLLTEVCEREAWVLDSAWGVWTDVALARAELVVALDYPRWLSLARLLRRTAVRVVDRRPICNGNTETVRQSLSRDSIVAWHFRSFASKRRRIEEWEADPDVPPVLRMRHPRETEAWLAGLQRAGERA